MRVYDDRARPLSWSAWLLVVGVCVAILFTLIRCDMTRCERAGGKLKHVGMQTSVCLDADGRIIPY